jgi:hypothetical protein
MGSRKKRIGKRNGMKRDRSRTTEKKERERE